MVSCVYYRTAERRTEIKNTDSKEAVKCYEEDAFEIIHRMLMSYGLSEVEADHRLAELIDLLRDEL